MKQFKVTFQLTANDFVERLIWANTIKDAIKLWSYRNDLGMIVGCEEINIKVNDNMTTTGTTILFN